MVACSAGVFFANVFAKGCYFKDGGYNNTNINKQLSPAHNTPALQAIKMV